MINRSLVQERLLLVLNFHNELFELSKMNNEEFLAESRNVAAAESYLRRSLEAIFDIGRHVLAKTGNIKLSLEYKAIAKGLHECNVISQELANKLVNMAGYRNRLVHLYHQITDEELHHIIKNDLRDLKRFVIEIKGFLDALES